MPTAFPERWRDLKRLLDGDLPASRDLYIRPPRSCAEDIAEEIRSDPAACPKYLLIGPRGGGKSTELREIGRQLDGDLALVEIDLDRSGISAASVTAADLLYLSGLGLLRYVERADRDRAEELFSQLKLAYAGSSEAAGDLGKLGDALAGLSAFSTATATAAVAAGGGAGGGLAVGAILGAAAAGVRLFAGRPGVVPETSPTGRALQQAIGPIVEAARGAVSGRGFCVLVDGLEKMNGQAGERFRQVFQQTRLLADARWSAVYAAPPTTLTETDSVDSLGWHPVVVWGFHPADQGLVEALVRRFELAEMPAGKHVARADLDRIAAVSGGLPRHAIDIAHRAAELARRAGGEVVDSAHVDDGITWKGEALGRGLHAGDLDLLARVHRDGVLPRDGGAAALFAHGRIIAVPPTPGHRVQRFVVHPLLADEVARLDGGA